MSHHKRKIEEIFDEHENMPCSTNKIRKIQSNKQSHRDFKIKYWWNNCPICKNHCRYAVTLDYIHYQCYQCFDINAVNEEKRDIFNSIYGAISNVYIDLLIDKNIIHLIANYSTGVIAKCCNEKCPYIMTYPSFFQFHYDTKQETIYHYKIELNLINVSTRNIYGNKVRFFCRKCRTENWRSFDECCMPKCKNSEISNYYDTDKLMLHNSHYCVNHLSQLIQNTNVIRMQIKKCIIKLGIDDAQIIDGICDCVCADGNIVDCCNEKCNEEIIISDGYAQLICDTNGKHTHYQDVNGRTIEKYPVNRSDINYKSKSKTVYLRNKEMRIFCRFCSSKSVRACKVQDCDYYDLKRNFLFGCIVFKWSTSKNYLSCKRHSQLKISFSNEEIKLISEELNVNIMQLIVNDIKQYEKIEMNIDNLQNNQLILHIRYSLFESITRKKKNGLKLSGTCKSIAKLNSVKFLKKLTGEGITFMRHFKHSSKETKVSICGNKCKMLEIDGRAPIHKASFKIGKGRSNWKSLKNIPPDCCCRINHWVLSSVNQNKSEIEQFIKILNACDNGDFMNISNLFQLCLSPLFECL